MNLDIGLPEVEFRGNYVPLRNTTSVMSETGSESVMFDPNSSKLLSRSSNQLEEHIIETPFNFPVKVFVKRSSKSTPIITFHDVGTNHNSMLGFFNYREMKVLLKHFTVYHICAPGHYERSPVIDLNGCFEEEKDILLSNPVRSNSLDSNRPLNLKSSNAQYSRYPTLDELAIIVESVVRHFQLKYLIGFGMGAGSNILCRYALKNQDNVRALFLLNPDAGVHGYYEWFKLRWFDIPSMKKGTPVTDPVMNFLESHWFGFQIQDGQNVNQEVSQYYEQITHDLNPANVAGFLDSWLTRTDLGLVRTLGPDSVKCLDSDHCLRCDTCLVTGALSTDLARTLSNMNGRMDPAKTQFLILEDCNGMIMEERPDKLAINFLYFLRTIGLLINLQPEMLIRQAEELQNEEFKALQNGDNPVIPAMTFPGNELETVIG